MIPEKLVNQYIDAYNRINASDVKEIEELAEFSYKHGKRKKESSSGVVIGTKRNAQGELTVYRTKQQQHVLVNAATGLGKTQGYVLNSVINLDGKTSAVITDPKGEIASLTYNQLCLLYGEENVNILNFREPANSQLRYNPFKTLAEQYYETGNLPREQRLDLRDRITAKLQVLVSGMFGIRTLNDVSWDIGSRDLIFAIFLGLMEDTCEDAFEKTGSCGIRRLIIPDEVTIGNVLKIFSRFSWTAGEDWGDLGFFYSRSDSSVAKQRAKTVLGTSSLGTRTSYLSMVNSFFEPYFNPKILEITSGHTVDVLKMAKTPGVLFIIYDMADESIKKLVNDCVVNSLILLSEEYCKTSKPLQIPIVFLCDEFSSLEPHDIYPNVLSVGRGMNIYLHLIIQSIAQLRAAYKDKADILIENCGVKLFLGTNNYETAREFMKEAGDSVQLSKADLLSGKIAFAEKPRIKMDKIMYGMERGECFVKMLNTPPIHSYFEMYYKTPEYHTAPEFDVSSITAPKTNRKEIFGCEENSAEEAEKRKKEILDKMMRSIDECADGDGEEDEDEVLSEEVEDAIDCLRPLSENELDLVEAAVARGRISECWIRDYACCGELEPKFLIEFFLKLGIIKQAMADDYEFVFSLKVFKKARKRL